MSRMERAQDIATVKLPERLDSTTAASAEATLRAALRPGAKVIVDGSSVIYMSAAGVRALAGMLHGAQALDACLVFCQFSGPAADCLEVSGFTQLLDVAASLEEAADRLKTSGADASKRLHRQQSAG
jgi:anti-sigma B factor antagonist